MLNTTSTSEQKTVRELLESFRVILRIGLDGHDPRVRDMMKYVHLHLYRNSLSVQDIKDACRCKNHNIVSLFKQELELDVHHYIATLRLEAAAHVLRRNKVTITLLATCVGYTGETF